MLRALLIVAAAATACAVACSRPSTPAIQVQRNLLSVDNHTSHDWLGVEIWINDQYRVAVPRIAAHSRFTTTLDVFVAGFGQRFDNRRQRIDVIRLSAHEPNGAAVEIRFGEQKRGSAGARPSAS